MVAVVEKDYPEVVNVEEETHQVVVVSDLHLSGGQYEEDGKYRATENFFYDDEFAGFLSYLQRNRGERPWKLIINGDFIDFIRLTETPSPDVITSIGRASCGKPESTWRSASCECLTESMTWD